MAFLGIKLADGTFYPIITESEQGTTKLDLTTVENGQTTVQVDLYRSPDCKKTEFIDTLQLENLVPHKEGEQDVSLMLTLSKNGNLTAEIYNAESGLRSETKINDIFSIPPNPAAPSDEGLSGDDLSDDDLSDESADSSADDDPVFDDDDEYVVGDARSVTLGEINLPKTDDTILQDMSFAMDDSGDFDLAEDLDLDDENLDESLDDENLDESLDTENIDESLDTENIDIDMGNFEPLDMDNFAPPDEDLDLDADDSTPIEYDDAVGEVIEIVTDENEDNAPIEHKSKIRYTQPDFLEETPDEELEALERELDNLTEVLNGNSDEFDDVMPADKPPTQHTTPVSVIEKMPLENVQDSDMSVFAPAVSIDSSPIFEDGVVFEHRSALKVVPTTKPDASPIPASVALNAAKLLAEPSAASYVAEPTQTKPPAAKASLHHAAPASMAQPMQAKPSVAKAQIPYATPAPIAHASIIHDAHASILTDDEEDEMANEEPKIPQSDAMVGFARVLGFFAVAACVAVFMLFSGLWTIGSNGSEPNTFFSNMHSAPSENENPPPANLIEESDLTLIPSGGGENAYSANDSNVSLVPPQENIKVSQKNLENAASADLAVAHAAMQDAEAFAAVLTPANASDILPKTPAKSARKEETAYYEIIWGDTLWDISYSYYKNGHFFRKIADHNGIKNPSQIISGTVIEIPQI
ncbi:MAG: hypothetical protein Ta2A_04150 [Treponemataceae bacterium]|nr:MAG: hypothetical protein Ta2A_04150 [Treponemataceae bacterium]